MTSDDPTHRGAAPPPVDLAGHFRELGRALPAALLIAIVVAGAVFGLRVALTEKEYAASIVTEITPVQTPIPGDAFIEQMRAPFMGLAQDSNVLNQVLFQVDTGGWDAETLKQHVQLSPGPSPQLLIFTVTAGSPELAQQIAQSMVVTVAQASFANHTRDLGRQLDKIQAAIATEESTSATLAPEDPARADSDARLADLRAQLTTLKDSGGGDALTVLARPEQDPDPVEPQPLSEALVAGVVALVVAAELIVLWRGRVGTRPNRTWARRMAHRHRADFDARRDADSEIPPLLAAQIAQIQRAGRGVLVLLGDDATFPRSGALPDRSTNGDRRTLTAVPLATPWWRHVDTQGIALAVVIVRPASRDRTAADDALRQLAGQDVPRWLVLQRPQPAKRHRGEPAGRGARNGHTDGAHAVPSDAAEARTGLPQKAADDHVG